MQKAIGSITEGSSGCSVAFVEGLLSLVTVLVSSSSGCAALGEADLIPALLPVLKDMDPQHTLLVSATVHILEAFMDYNNPTGTLFRDLGGVGELFTRLKVEVTRVAKGDSKPSSKDKAAMVYTPPLYQLCYEDVDSQSSQVTGQAETLIPYHQGLLLKALLRAIALGTHSPENSMRFYLSKESDLPFCLLTIFRYLKEFGGGVFSLAASVMSDLLRGDPTCFTILDTAGLPSAFLDAILFGVLPSAEAVGCILNSLDALCLSNSGLRAVQSRGAVYCFIKIFTSKLYIRVFADDMPEFLASSFVELLGHVPVLTVSVTRMCVAVLKTIAAIGNAPVELAVPVDAPVPMDTDVAERSGATPDNLPDLELFLPLCISNTVPLVQVLLRRMLESDVDVIKPLLKLYALPHLPVSFGGSSTAHDMSVIFCACSNYGAVTMLVFEAFAEHLQAAFAQLKLVPRTKLSDLDSGERNKLVRSLLAAECYLSLSVVLARRSGSFSIYMMTELGRGAALCNIGTVHREVLWQIAQIDNAKVESKKEAEGGSSTPVSGGVGTVTREEGEDVAEPYPVVRYVNPAHIQNGPSSHWGVEPEFLPMVHASDGLHRRSRRDHAANAVAPTQIARLGQWVRQANATQVDTESFSESPLAMEVGKRKSPESMNYDMMIRLTAAVQGLYEVLGEAMMTQRRQNVSVGPNITTSAETVSRTLAMNFRHSLNFTDECQCQHLGAVAENLLAVVFNSRRRSCNNILLRNLYGLGAIEELLKTFAATSQLPWALLQSSGEATLPQSSGEANSWLLDTLLSYASLMEHLVTPSLLLTPARMAQILIQPVDEARKPPAKDPEAFVRCLQAEILKAVLPMWNHPQFADCSATFITSIASIITNVYTGAGDAKTSRAGGATGAGARMAGPPPDESDHQDSQNPSVNDLFLTYINCLHNVTLPVSGLLVTMCKLNKGQVRTQVIPHLVRQLKSCKVDGSVTDTRPLLTISHTLALVLSEDSTAREIAAENGAVSIVLDVLEKFRRVKTSLEDETPKWLTALLLVLENMLVCKLKIMSEQHKPSGLATAATASNNMGVSSGTPTTVERLSEAFKMQNEITASPFVSVFGKPSGYMSEDEQKRVISVATGFLQMQLPSATVQGVLQLCARLTKSYPIASAFFDSGGLATVLRLPRSCLIPGFDTIAAIIRHLLEDPQTLRQVMETEIRHTLITTLSRDNGWVSPRMFLTAMAPAVSCDPAIFMQAASVVCQLETVGGRPKIVLAKEKEKGHIEVDESGKIARGHHHKKVVLHSFSLVIDQLIDHVLVLQYPSATTDPVYDKEEDLSLEDNTTEVKDKGKGKVEDRGDSDMSESSASLAKVTFILGLIIDIILMYSSAMSVILRRDLESSQGRRPSQGVEFIRHGGLLYHSLHRLLPYPGEKGNDKVNEEVWREKLSDMAAYFMMAVCGRSEEGRRRVAVEIVHALTTASPTSSGLDSDGLKGLQSPSRKERAFVDFVNFVISSRSPAVGAQALGFSQDMAMSMMDAGMILALTCTLQVMDLDHPDAPKLVNSILTALEALTRASSMTERAYGSDGVAPQKATEERGDVTSNSLWNSTSSIVRSTSSIVRDAEAMLGGIGGGALDVTHVYVYGAPMITEHIARGLIGERELGGAPLLLDVPMDPVDLMGRRGGRTESRLSSRIDDGQSQAGAQAAAVAQASDEKFIKQLRLLVPSAEPMPVQSPAVVAESSRVPVAARNIVEGDEVAADPPSEGGVGSTGPDVIGRLDSGSATVNQSSAGAGAGGTMDRGLGSGVGLGLGRRPVAISCKSKMQEAEGEPLVDTPALKALLRLLRLAQLLGKDLLQRLLLNLCAHSATRLKLLQLLLKMLCPGAEGISAGGTFADGAQSQRLYGCHWSVVYARSHARPQMLDESASDSSDSTELFGESPLIRLLKLLSQPLCSRSTAYLEQVMELLEGVTPPAPSGGEAYVHTEASRPDASGASAIPANPPEPELRNLCRILAQKGQSDTTYQRVAEVLKKLATGAPTHRRLFVAELDLAVGDLSGPAVDELGRLGDGSTFALSTTSMGRVALLRVLQVVIALTLGIRSASEQDAEGEEKEWEDVLLVGDLKGGLEKLWERLSLCVGTIEGRLGNSTALSASSSSASFLPAVGPGSGSVPPPLPPGIQKLLPFVEAFFMLCEKFKTGAPQPGQNEPHSATASEIKEAEASHSGDLNFSPLFPPSPRHPQKALNSESEKIMTRIRFADKHQRLLNAFVRLNPDLLEKSLCFLLRTPHLLNFDNKRAYFRSCIRQQPVCSPLHIHVRRVYLLEDSCKQLQMRTPDQLKGLVTIEFHGEKGTDEGGLTREWYQLLSRAMFDKGALLFMTVGNESTLQPNPNSVYQTEHLAYFKFVGRVVTKALFDGQLFNVHFTRSFYKHILGVKVTYHDMKAIDLDYFKNLKWMLENNISDIPKLTFSMDADEEKHILYEKTKVTDLDFELIPSGRDILVTEENKHEYVDKVAEHRLTTAIRPQIDAFMEGFNELVSRELISIFDEKELELLISGLPEIDLEDLKANTEYTGYTAASPVVQWFWDVVRSFSKEDMARFLQFVTGTSTVPLEGFRALQGSSSLQ